MKRWSFRNNVTIIWTLFDCINKLTTRCETVSFIYCNFTTWSFQSNQKLSTVKEAVRLCGIPNNPWDDHDQLPFEVYIIIIYSEVKFPYMCILATWYPTINFIWKMRLSARGCIWYFGSAAWIHPAPSLCRQMVLLKNNFYYEVILEVEVDFRISGNWLVATDLKNCVFPNTSLSWFHVAV